MTWPIFGAGLDALSFSQCQVETFSSASLMSLLHLVAAHVCVFVVVYFSKLRINIQKLCRCIYWLVFISIGAEKRKEDD